MPRYASDCIQQFKGSHKALQSYAGKIGEIFYDITQQRFVAMDGETLGGVPMAKLSEIGASGDGKMWWDFPFVVIGGDTSETIDVATFIVPPEAKYAAVLNGAAWNCGEREFYDYVTGETYDLSNLGYNTIDISASAGHPMVFRMQPFSSAYASSLYRFYSYDPNA